MAREEKAAAFFMVQRSSTFFLPLVLDIYLEPKMVVQKYSKASTAETVIVTRRTLFPHRHKPPDIYKLPQRTSFTCPGRPEDQSMN